MSLLSLFEWLDGTALAAAFHDSVWAFAASETVHLLFLAALGGVVLLENLRLLGVGLTQPPLAAFLKQLRRLYWPSLAGVIVSGSLMVLGESLKVYHHTAFRWKMALFAVALALSHGLHERAANGREPFAAGVRVLAAINLLVWFSVGLAGRAVGFL